MQCSGRAGIRGSGRNGSPPCRAVNTEPAGAIFFSAGRDSAGRYRRAMLRRTIARILTPPMIVLAALFMFVEEWIWDHLAAFMAWVGRAPALRWAEARIAALPPYAAMAAFLLPGLILMPVKISAFWLAARGHAVYAAGVFIAAKATGTAVAARLFTLCRPSLLTVGWFRRAYEWLGRLKNRLYHSAPWQAAVQWKNRFKSRWARLTAPLRGGRLKRRWKAITHLTRHKLTRRKASATTEAKEPDSPA